MLFSLVPGLPDRPHGTQVHRFWPALGEALWVTVLAGVVGRVVILRGER